MLGTAVLLRDFLADRGLTTMIKTSGGKGLYIVLLLIRAHDWGVMKPFSRAVAGAVAAYNPRRLLIKSKRTSKIYIDWMRNGRGATCIAPWGFRAHPGATVSMQITWEQLPELAAAGFTILEPPQKPDEWVNLRPQKILKKLLRDLGVL